MMSYRQLVPVIAILMLPVAYAQPAPELTPKRPPAFTQPDLSVDETASHLVLVGNLHFSLSKTAAEAMDNGLPLTMITEISLRDPQKWLLGKDIWKQQVSHQIQYHALSDQYLVRGAKSRYHKAFLSRATALDALGDIDNIKLADKSLLQSVPRYELRVNTRLDIQSLPTPLRPLAFLSSEWKLQNEWKTWQKR